MFSWMLHSNQMIDCGNVLSMMRAAVDSKSYQLHGRIDANHWLWLVSPALQISSLFKKLDWLNLQNLHQPSRG